jgi:membrane-associated phospholipid phosphatase
VRRSQALALAGAGAATYALSARGAASERPQAIESKVFHAVNDLPDGLYPVLWGPMQLGNLVVGAGVAAGVAAATRHPKVAGAALVATGLKLGVERVIRGRLGPQLAHRQRPGTLQADATLRGDVPAEGHSFPSGHVILVFAQAAVLTPMLHRKLALLPWIAAGLVGFGRIYVGAHNPLDVTAGAGVGITVGALLDAALGDDHHHPTQLDRRR